MWPRVVVLLRLGEEETVSESQVVRGFLSSFLQLIFTETAQNGMKALVHPVLGVFSDRKRWRP